LTPSRPRVDRVWFHRLKLKYDELLSSVAFNFNFRRLSRCSEVESKRQAAEALFAEAAAAAAAAEAAAEAAAAKVAADTVMIAEVRAALDAERDALDAEKAAMEKQGLSDLSFFRFSTFVLNYSCEQARYPVCPSSDTL